MNTKYRITQEEEEAIILMASNGDLDAFNQLVIVYQDMLYNHVYSILGEPESAEDVTQDSFIKAFQKLNSFRGGSFRGWLMRIAINSAYDLLRRSKRYLIQPLVPENENGEDVESASWLADPSVSIQDAFEQNELSKTIFSLVEELPEVYRIVLTLIDIQEFDYAEAAKTLEVPIGTVKSRLARARLKMSEKLHNAKIYSYSDIHRRKKLDKMIHQKDKATTRNIVITTRNKIDCLVA